MEGEKIVTIDVTEKNESDGRTGRSGQHGETEILGSGAVSYVDRIQMTMVKLTDANKRALDRYGNLQELSLPDALYEVSKFVSGTGGSCYIQLLQRSAELLHPKANYDMGTRYKYGHRGVDRNLELAVFHFRVASSRGRLNSMIALIAHYHDDNAVHWNGLERQ